MKYYLIHIADWFDNVVLRHRYIRFCEWIAFSNAWPAFCSCWYCKGVREDQHDEPGA